MSADPATVMVSIILALVLIVVGLYDLIAVLWFGQPATVSAVVLQIAKRHPILPLAVGVLIGHLFWPQ